MVMVDPEEMAGMEGTQTPLESDPSEISSWVTEGTTSPPSTDKVPEGKVCESCGTAIIRKPGQRGKLPRYCETCKATKPAGSSSRKNPRGEGRTKAEQEADFLAEKFREQMNKAAVIVGVFDPFDGYAIVTQSKPMSESVRQVLTSYDRLRKPLLDGQGSSGVLGLIMSSLFIALPILAHHGIIPETIGGKKVGEFLQGLPAMLQKFQKAAEHAEAELADRLAAQQEEEAAA